MPRAARIAAVALLAAGFAAPAAAQPLEPLAPVGGPPLGSTPVTPSRSSQSFDRPPPVLGAPVGVAEVSPQPAVAPAGFVDAPAARKPQRAAAFGAPSAGGEGAIALAQPAAPVSAAAVENVARPASEPPAADPVNDFLNKRSELKDRDDRPARGKSSFPSLSLKTAKMPEWAEIAVGDHNGGWFRSDHLFDGFISPVTNPFLFEDPRSLTEARPIFLYQHVPSRQPDFHGGHVSFFGVQGRVAFTDRWSLVMSKFGGISVNTNDPSPFPDKTSFAELWLGPKYTFYRGEETGSIAAAGLQFQIPTGSRGAFQNTGSLSLVPYVSYGQNLFRDFSLGSFNLMASTGYAFSVNRERSDYYWLSAHLDLDAGNLHKFYPLMELNWFLNTTNGKSVPIGAEGRDLINFGGQASGTGLLTLAFGGRVKITEAAQLGAAFEFPIAGRRDIFGNRFTLDFILRY